MTFTTAALALLAIPQSTPALTLPPGGVDVPMERWRNRPVVEVSIGGFDKVRMMIDTGTGGLVLSPGFAEKIGVGDEAEEPPQVTFGGATVRPNMLRVVAFMSQRAGGGSQPIEGILGLSTLEEALITLDFANGRVRLSDGSLEGVPGAVPLEDDEEFGRVLCVPVVIGDVRVKAHLDTGSPSLLALPSSFAERVPLDGEPTLAGRAMTPMGSADILRARVAGSMSIAGVTFENAEIDFADLPQLHGSVGNVGMGLLDGRTMKLDRTNRLLLLESPVDASRALARLSGETRIEARFRRAPDAEFESGTGHSTWTAARHGRYAHEQFRVLLGGREVSGEAFVGPSDAPSTVHVIQFDTVSPAPVVMRGRWTDAQILEVESSDATPPRRWVVRFDDDGTWTKEIHVRLPNGEWFLASDYHYLPVDAGAGK